MICVVEASLGHALRRLFNSVEELRGAVRSKEARLLGANSNVSLQARKSGGFNPTWPNIHQVSVVFQFFWRAAPAKNLTISKLTMQMA
jgi:hypothetical protein